MHHIDIETQHHPLSREVWRFWVSFPQIVLDSYLLQERPSTRHKWRTVKHFSRMDARRHRWDRDFLRQDDVPLSAELQARVKAQAAVQLMVVREYYHISPTR